MANSKKLRIPPQNLDAERAVLGSIMVRGGAFKEIEDVVYAESFYSDKHRRIFEAMRNLANASEPIDFLSVSSKLDELNSLESVGGRTYLTELINTVPASTNVKYYAHIVGKKNVLRNLIEAGDYITELSFEAGDEDVDEVLDKAEKKIFSVVQSPSSQKVTPIKQSLTEAWERLERLHQSKGELRGIPTGFSGLDNILAGLQRSDLIILAARPSIGKTALALDIARKVATQHNVPVGIFSLEMSSGQLIDRMLAAQSQVDAWKLRTGKITREEEFEKIRDSLDVLSKAPIFVDDTPGNSVIKIRSTARRMKAEHNLGLIVIDYLQLMTSNRQYDSMVMQVTEISKALKSLARELDVPVLALSQLSRAIESRGGKPRLSDLRDSGSIEQDADVVMFIHREDKYKEKDEKTNIAEILIEKHRNGPTGKVDLYFDEKKTSFIDMAEKGVQEGLGPNAFEADDNLDDF